MNLIFCFLIVIGLLCSCNGSNYYSVDSTVEIECQEKIDTIQYEKIIRNYAEIKDILCSEKYLIVIQNNNDSIFKILDTTNDSIVGVFGQIGHSKDEFSQIPLFYYLTEDGKYLCVQEIDRTKVIDIEQSVQNKRCITSNTIMERESPITHESFHINQMDKFVDKGVTAIDARDPFREKPSCTYFKNNKVVKKWEIYPAMVQTDEPNLLDLLYVDKFFLKDDGTKAISMMKFLDYLTIFDLKTYKTLGVIGTGSYGFDYFNNEITSKNHMEKLKIYNMSAFVDNERIFILKDGRLYKDMLEAKDDNYNSQIDILSWDGKLLSSFAVDKSLWDIGYVRRTNTLYGVSLNLDLIYKYKLK